MFFRNPMIVGGLFIAASISVVAIAAAEEDPRDYEVRSIRAFLFYPELGRFGEKDLFAPNTALRNVVIGGGDAEAPSSSTLVLVTIDGPSFSADAEGTLELSSKAAGATPTIQSLPFRWLLTDEQSVTAPFLINGVGCVPLELEARITGLSSNPASKRATIPFHCGE